MSTSDIVIAHEPPQEQASVSLYAWVIVAIATVCLALGFGANIVISVFMKPFEDEFGWLRADTSMAYTMNAIGAGAGGILWGGLSDVVGPKRIGVFGAIALSLGLIAMRWQSELWSLYLVSFLIGAFGFASLFTPMVALAGRWFSTRKGLAIGIVTADENRAPPSIGISPVLAQRSVFMSSNTDCCPVARTSSLAPFCSLRE